MALYLLPEIDFAIDSPLQIDDINLPGDERESDSPYIERVWHSQNETGGSFLSTAHSHSELVVTKQGRSIFLTVRGPESRVTTAHSPSDAEFMGIVLKIGTFMPQFPASTVMDRRDIHLPQAGSHSFWLDSSAWEFPTFENAETFINRLVRAGLLVSDPLVDVVLRQQPSLMSRRTMQRRFLQATGLTYNNLFQIQRARHATNLLKAGESILTVAELAGYADQSHMTRALKQLMGYTPGQIASGNTDMPMSFLFKTSPF